MLSFDWSNVLCSEKRHPSIKTCKNQLSFLKADLSFTGLVYFIVLVSFSVDIAIASHFKRMNLNIILTWLAVKFKIIAICFRC